MEYLLLCWITRGIKDIKLISNIIQASSHELTQRDNAAAAIKVVKNRIVEGWIKI